MDTSDIIADYKMRVKSHGDKLISGCLEEKDILKVIEMAAGSRDKNNVKHPHQYRVSNHTLRKFTERVLRNADRIILCKSFEQLYTIIGECRIRGIGVLTIYDTAHRIGLRLKVYPEVVYMHQGTRAGAEKYLKRKATEKFLDKSLFKDFKSLRCDEIEDILCIYKSNFASSSNCIRASRNSKFVC